MTPGAAAVGRDAEREASVAQALLRAVVGNLKSNRLVVPVFGLVMCGMFPQWIEDPVIATWYGQMLLGLVPQMIVLARFPRHDMRPAQARKWTFAVTAANLFFVVNWASFAFYFWAPGKNTNHVMIELVLGATLAAHASITGPCRAIARPALLLYLVVMVLVPLQAFLTPQYPHAFERAILMAAGAPLYVAFIAFISRRNYLRARTAVVTGAERNALLAELVRAKKESDRGRARAEAASQAKSQFLANMSHELRTPLNAILGFSEVIATRMFHDQPERHVEYAALINTSGHHLLALINDILDLAKIEAGRWKLEEAEVDLHRVADDALQLVTWKARANNAVLRNAIAPDVALIHADERAIKQILLNLLSNAVKFTPENGCVTAFARTGADGGIAFGVTDTGIGIAAADQVQVFDSFGQGQHDIAIADKGTGLGLAIVKGLMEAHGGHVTLESEVGKGTCVTMHLPASRVRPRARPILQDNGAGPADDLAHFVA